ncbi:MAG: uncharacterized protein K0R71_1703 [Bacillales bacterium]|jgi:uncharacterized membrane protein|nr:uncharacterized protein [Bacillales bacterium]
MKKLLFILSLTTLMLILTACGDSNSKQSNSSESKNSNQTIALTVSPTGDVELPIKEVSEKATFYTFTYNNMEMGALAVKASDGTVRTALNTCQVCFDSGKGYYLQEGDKVKCQNCGNLFGIDDIELVHGGCNPVPITEEFKTDGDGTVTISNEFLKQSEPLFKNWKN